MGKEDPDCREIPVTKAMIDRLVTLNKKTCCSFSYLYKYGKTYTGHAVFTQTPDTLPQMWINGKVKTAHRDYYDAIIGTYENIPKFHRGEFLFRNADISDEFRARLEVFVNKKRQLSLKKILSYSHAQNVGLSRL